MPLALFFLWSVFGRQSSNVVQCCAHFLPPVFFDLVCFDSARSIRCFLYFSKYFSRHRFVRNRFTCAGEHAHLSERLAQNRTWQTGQTRMRLACCPITAFANVSDRTSPASSI